MVDEKKFADAIVIYSLCFNIRREIKAHIKLSDVSQIVCPICDFKLRWRGEPGKELIVCDHFYSILSNSFSEKSNSEFGPIVPPIKIYDVKIVLYNSIDMLLEYQKIILEKLRIP